MADWRPEAKLRGVDLGLTQQEREFLVTALDQWGGPARPTDAVARLAGFAGRVEMADAANRIRTVLESDGHLARHEWRSTLVAAELVFGSDTYGAGVEWEIVTGADDAASLNLLRQLQRKLVGVCPPARRPD